jgi:hypothetical protein
VTKNALSSTFLSRYTLSSSQTEERAIVKYKFPLPLDGQLGFALYGAFIAVGRTYRMWLDQIGLTYPQYLVVSVLWEDDDQTITAIASRLDLEPSTITPLVKRLEQAASEGSAHRPGPRPSSKNQGPRRCSLRKGGKRGNDG